MEVAKRCYHYFTSVTLVVLISDQNLGCVDGSLKQQSVATWTTASALLLPPERNVINL